MFPSRVSKNITVNETDNQFSYAKIWLDIEKSDHKFKHNTITDN